MGVGIEIVDVSMDLGVDCLEKVEEVAVCMNLFGYEV